MRFFSRLGRDLAALDIQFAAAPVAGPPAVLLPGEEVAVAGASPRRRRQYATGRWCARRALAGLGIAARPIPSAAAGAVGAPVWPGRVCGSISHTPKAGCAAAAWMRSYRGLGIDLESRTRRVSRGALALIANPDELRWLADRQARDPRLALFLASAKESAFKLLSPLVRKRIPCTAFSLLRPASKRTYTVVLNQDLGREFRRGAVFRGLRFEDPEWMVTLCVLPAAGYC